MTELEQRLKSMKVAIPSIEALCLTCPHCNQEMASPTGALNWTLEELLPGLLALPCSSCGKEVKLPHGKVVKVP